MGNKTNPIGMRLQVNRTWDSRWYADTKDYGDLLLEDLKIRDFIHEECKQAGVARVIIERPHKKCRVTIHTARPGVIIGKKGADIETLRKKIAAMTDSELHLNIVEVRKPELDARLVGESIAQQLERRVAFRRAQVVNREVVSITFNPETEVVEKVDHYTLEDGKVIAYNDRETPTRGRELTVLEQLLGNVGRGGMLPRDDEGVPGTRPGDR